MSSARNIPIRNIYYMLAYVFTALRQLDYENLETEDFEDIHNLFAAILAKGISRQLKQGLHRDYIHRHEDLATVRGRIDMRGTIRTQYARQQLIACDFDELSADTLVNQVLKSTALLLLRHADVDQRYSTALKRELLYFSDVSACALSTVNWSSFAHMRLAANNRLLIGLCQLVAEGLLLTTERGETRLARFLDDARMSWIYERFILEYYRRHWPQLSPRAAQIPWALDDGEAGLLPTM